MSRHRRLKWVMRLTWPLARILRLRKVPKIMLAVASERYGVVLKK